MDLAEIRKKARKERDGNGSGPVPPREIPEESGLEPVEPVLADWGGEEGISDEIFPEPVDEPAHYDELLPEPVDEPMPGTAYGLLSAPTPEPLPEAAEERSGRPADDLFPETFGSRFDKVFEQVPENYDPLAVLIAGRTDLQSEREEPEQTGVTTYSAGEEFQEFLCFRVSSEIYAINILAIKEIIKPREVTDIPRAPAFVSGILSLRGIIIPIFNMRLRLGLPEGEKSGRQRIIVVRKGEEFVGLVVDEVTQVVRIASATVENPPAVLDGIDRDFVAGIGRCNGQMLILLNQEKILDISLGQSGERGRA